MRAVLAGRGLRGAVLVVVTAEVIRSLVIFGIVSAWILLYSGQGPEFSPFYLLFAGTIAVIVGVFSVVVAGVTGALTSVVRTAVRG